MYPVHKIKQSLIRKGILPTADPCNVKNVLGNLSYMFIAQIVNVADSHWVLAKYKSLFNYHKLLDVSKSGKSV